VSITHGYKFAHADLLDPCSVRHVTAVGQGSHDLFDQRYVELLPPTRGKVYALERRSKLGPLELLGCSSFNDGSHGDEPMSTSSFKNELANRACSSL
jgi:hypothetical protein